jgi:GntR family transcriptional repressor for pyruvate dehydrogenase complex
MAEAADTAGTDDLALYTSRREFTEPIFEESSASAAASLAARLRRKIVETRPAPGTRLYSLRSLQQETGFSLSVVREALQMLAGTGLVNVRQGAKGGVYASRAKHIIISHSLNALIVSNDISNAVVLEARQELEAVCGELAVRHATDADLAELEESVQKCVQYADDPLRCYEEAQRFHNLLSVATGNPVIGAISTALADCFFAARTHVPYSEGVISDLTRAHRAILRAIKNRDAEAARKAMIRHAGSINDQIDRMEAR